MIEPPDISHVAGVDGCPGGWIMVHHPINQPANAAWEIFATFRDLFEFAKTFKAIAIDMPIGLPGIASAGGRQADRDARAVLGARQSSVFAIPARSAIYCTEYREACDTALNHSDPPRKVAKQTFNLFPKIREIDQHITPADQDRIVECHPEVAFWAMNNNLPLTEPKKVRSKPYQPGLDLRRNLLTNIEFTSEFLIGPDCPRRVAAPDDFLDACAATWTANRLANNSAERFPAEPPLDPRGLRMQIVY